MSVPSPILDISQLQEIARKARVNVIKMLHEAGSKLGPVAFGSGAGESHGSAPPLHEDGSSLWRAIVCRKFGGNPR